MKIRVGTVNTGNGRARQQMARRTLSGGSRIQGATGGKKIHHVTHRCIIIIVTPTHGRLEQLANMVPVSGIAGVPPAVDWYGERPAHGKGSNEQIPSILTVWVRQLNAKIGPICSGRAQQNSGNGQPAPDGRRRN